MPSFDRINRRTHLYLGLVLAPWVVMYGLSSLLISHASRFKAAPVPWELMFERPYHRVIPAGGDLRPVAHEILKEHNLEGVFYVQQPNPRELRINRQTFFDQTRLIYSLDTRMLKAERQPVPWNQTIVRMHFRGGYEQPLFLNKVWGVIVDLACISILLWIATGLVMWWRLSATRTWGVMAIGAGALSFVFFVWQL